MNPVRSLFESLFRQGEKDFLRRFGDVSLKMDHASWDERFREAIKKGSSRLAMRGLVAEYWRCAAKAARKATGASAQADSKKPGSARRR